jgi:hypothetical protein
MHREQSGTPYAESVIEKQCTGWNFIALSFTLSYLSFASGTRRRTSFSRTATVSANRAVVHDVNMCMSKDVVI